MSRRVSTGASNWMKFCKHMREAIIDEQKAVPDYEKLLAESRDIMQAEYWDFADVIDRITNDEKWHKKMLLDVFDNVCPKMAVHREGITQSGVYHGGKKIYKRLPRKHHRRHMEGY